MRTCDKVDKPVLSGVSMVVRGSEMRGFISLCGDWWWWWWWRSIVSQVDVHSTEDRQVCVGVVVGKESLFRGSKIVRKMLYNETNQ